MVHIAVMKPSWRMIEKILSGEKTIESRWFKTKRAPWNKVRVGETIYFKNSGERVTAKATVARVFQFSELAPRKIKQILAKFGPEIGIGPEFYRLVRDKKYCLLIFLEKPSKVPPFLVSKKGFGAQTAWISVPKLNNVKI